MTREAIDAERSGRLPTSRSTSPRNRFLSSSGFSPSSRKATPGASRATTSSRPGANAASRMSLARTVNVRSRVARSSSTAGSRIAAARRTRSCTSSRSARARAVGTISRPLRTSSASPVAARSRPSVRLTAGGLRWSWAAASCTLRCSSSASRPISRLRSTCTRVNRHVSKVHWTHVNGAAYGRGMDIDTRSHPDLELLSAVAQVAAEAGDRLLAVYSPGARPADRGELLKAAARNEEVSSAGLREALHALRPGARWLEEEDEAGPLPDGEWWVVDNAEGSVNHVHGMPEWGVSITLVADGVPLLGAFRQPVGGLTYTALRGHGAYRGSGAYLG